MLLDTICECIDDINLIKIGPGNGFLHYDTKLSLANHQQGQVTFILRHFREKHQRLIIKFSLEKSHPNLHVTTFDSEVSSLAKGLGVC